MANKTLPKRGATVVEQPSSDNRGLILGGVAAVLLLGIIALVFLVNRPAPVSLDGAYEGVATEGTFIGDPNAPVVVREFLDFTCPHCRSAATDLTPKVIENYVASGQVRMEFIPIAFNENSLQGAVASYCAAEQGQFMDYKAQLFANQRNSFSSSNLVSYAAAIGLDEQEFRNCLIAGYHGGQVQDNLAEFRSMGASSTPTFFVNDQMVVGAVPYTEMEEYIQQALASVQ